MLLSFVWFTKFKYLVLFMLPTDFTQDLASKGLSIVYDQSDEEGKKELVSVLVDRIVSGKR